MTLAKERLTADQVGAPPEFDLFPPQPDGTLTAHHALRWARWLSDHLHRTELDQPDQPEGDCDECGHHAHTRWAHGHATLCRTCRRRRATAAQPERPPPELGSPRIPHFAGECQRCTTTGPLHLIAQLFLCPLHATRARRAQHAAQQRARRVRTEG